MHALQTATSGFSTQPHAARTLEDTLAEVLTSVTRAGSLLAHAGVLVGRPPDFRCIATSDALIAEVHAQHAMLDEGPCTEAMATGLTVVSDSLPDERRWPRWTASALAGGIRASVGVPLLWEGRTLGALGLYWEASHLLDTHVLNLADSCGVSVSAIVGWARSTQELQHALGTRQMIGQAVGVLMQRHGLSSDAAFAVLRRNSQNANLKLLVVARTFLETGELPQPPRRWWVDPTPEPR